MREGASAFLECNVSNLCMVQFHWTINEDPVLNTSRRYQNGSNLIITKVNKTLDSGEFRCIATVASTGNSRESSGASLSIQWISFDISVQREVDSKSQSSAELRLKCLVNGTEELTVRWFLNGRRLSKSHPAGVKFSVDDEYILTVRNPGPLENGVYSCEAKNSAGVVRSKRNYILSTEFTDLPKLVKAPENELVKVGDQVSIECQFSPNDNVAWRRIDDVKFGTNLTARIRQLSNGSLQIKDVTLSDSGTYECVAFGKNGLSHGYSATLTIAHLNPFDLHNFAPPSRVQYVGRNRDLEIGCQPPEGNPQPVAYWKKSSEKISSSGRVSVTDDLRLKILFVRQNDEGEYNCVAENLAGRTEGVVKIVVTNKPKIRNPPGSIDVVEGSIVELKCDYEGDPYPATTIEWRKTGYLIMPGSHHPHIRIFGQNGTIFFDQVTKNDSGHYDCVVRTGGQDPVVSTHAVITVKEKLKFAPKPVGRKLAFGSNAQIPCVAVGHFPPRVKWFSLNGANTSLPLKFDYLNSNFAPNVREKSGVLYFNSVRFENAGYYACAATSSQGLIHETIKVEVYIFPTVVQPPRNTTQVLDGESWLHCVVDGKPKPKIEWYHEGKSETEKWKFNYTRYENDTIYIRNVSFDHAGLYVCMAGNNGGFKRMEAYICVKHRSDHLADCGPQRIGVVDPASSNLNRNHVRVMDKIDANATGRSTSSKGLQLTVLTAVLLICGYFLLIVLFVIFCWYRRSRARMAKMTQCAQRTSNSNNGAISESINQPRVLFKNRAANNDFTTSDDAEILLGISNVNCQGNQSGLQSMQSRLMPPPSSYTRAIHGSNALPTMVGVGRCSPIAPSSIVSSCDVEKFKYARTSLEFVSLLGAGEFGEVHLMNIVYQHKNASVPDLSHSNQIALVKQFTNTKDDLACLELNREIEMYSKLSHQNLVKLIGVCVEKEPILVIYEYLEFGDLKHYLQATSKGSQPHTDTACCSPSLPIGQILSIANQVCSAMEYLINQRFLHKDLAARNVLISSALTAKVCQLSLSASEAFATDYITLGRRRVPLRWLPAEAALDDEHSAASDVYAFGTLVWEVFNHAATPHAALSDEQLLSAARRGSQPRLVPPAEAPESLRNILAATWQADSRRRPNFAQLGAVLEQCLSECNGC